MVILTKLFLQCRVSCCLQYTKVWGEPTKLYLMSDIRMERMVGEPGNKAILMSFSKWTKNSCAGVNSYGGGDQCQNVELFLGRWLCIFQLISYGWQFLYLDKLQHIWHANMSGWPGNETIHMSLRKWTKTVVQAWTVDTRMAWEWGYQMSLFWGQVVGSVHELLPTNNVHRNVSIRNSRVC